MRDGIGQTFNRFDTPVGHELIRILFRQSRIMFIGVLVTLAIIVPYFWGKTDHTLLLSWLVANVVLMVFRIAFVRRFARLNPQGRRIVFWGVGFALTSSVSGMLWGWGTLLFLQPGDMSELLLLSVLLVSMVAGSLVPLSSFIPAYFGYVLFGISPIIVYLLASQQTGLQVSGVLLATFVVVYLAYSFVVNRGLQASIRLRFQNLEILRDLERQKRISEQANADKSRFLAATSHDLRQPLHAMSLYLGALSAQLTEPGQRELLDKSLQSCDVLNSLLTALMDVSQLDAGEVNMQRRAVNVAVLLEGIASEFRPHAECKSIELRVLGEHVEADTDPVMFARIVRNLLANACTHSRAMRIELVANALEDEDNVIVSIRDNGIGIPAQEQAMVFSEFYQLDNAERDRAKGLGLGLSIVKRLADLLGHDLRLESTPGKGCHFDLTLPRATANGAQTVPCHTTVQADLGGRFIVLVDDEVTVRDAMHALLRQWGCELLVADGVESLRRELSSLDYPCPDIVIADYRLRNNTTGLDVIEMVCGHFGVDIPAVVVSGDTDQVVRQRVENWGCHLLHKPVSSEQMWKTLNLLLVPVGGEGTSPVVSRIEAQ